MKYGLLLTALALSAYLSLSLQDPVYTIHYVKNYRNDKLQDNFGCKKSVVFGSYTYPLGLIDAAYGLINYHQFGFSVACQRPMQYIKIFGEAQDYKQLTNVNDQQIKKIGLNLQIVNIPIIVDWKYMPAAEEERERAFQDLKRILMGLQ